MVKETEPLLKVSHLKTYFHTENSTIKAVDDISFHVNQGELVGIVGESGSGKSVTSLSIMRLIEQPGDRKSTRLNSSHVAISYAVFCLKKKKNNKNDGTTSVIMTKAMT